MLRLTEPTSPDLPHPTAETHRNNVFTSLNVYKLYSETVKFYLPKCACKLGNYVKKERHKSANER